MKETFKKKLSYGYAELISFAHSEFGKHLQRGAMQKLAPGEHLEI